MNDNKEDGRTTTIIIIIYLYLLRNNVHMLTFRLEKKAPGWNHGQQHYLDPIRAREKDYFLAHTVPADDYVTSGLFLFDSGEFLAM